MKPRSIASRSPRFSLWLASLTAAGLLPLGATNLVAQTTYTWNGGTGSWSNGALWSTGSLPNSTDADVFIDGGKTGTASVVSLDNNYTMGRLTVDAGDTLNVVNNTEWTISSGAFSGSGSLVNNGTINFNDTGSGTFLHFAGAGSITGTGTINLNANSRIFANNAGDRVTVGAGQTIAGRGFVGNGSTNFTNNGVVTANQNGNTLVLQPGGSYGFTNAGSGAARAENGGVLELAGGTFSGGAFTALTGSHVQVDNGTTVSGATLASVGTGIVTMDSATLTNATLAGSVSINNNAEAVVNGTLTNNGTLTVNDTGSGTFLRLGGATTLTGTGTVNLSGGGARLFANNAGDRLTIGSGATVAGRGFVGNGSTNFTNNGVVTANQNGNTLVLSPTSNGTGDFTNAGAGTARAENGGVLELAGGATFTGNSFTALAGSRVQVDNGAIVSNATLASVGTGTVTMFNATLTNATIASGSTVVVNNNAEATANGTLTNNGTLTINDAGSGTFLRLGSSTTLAGTGTVTLAGPAARLFANNAGDRLTIGASQTVNGAGNLGNGSTVFTNQGTVNANVNGGTLTVQPGGGAADFTNNGSLYASNGGTLQFSNAGGGKLTNNGTLYVYGGSTISVPAGALTNLSGTTLTGGTYGVSAVGTTTNTLSLGGGSIVTNNAVVFLSGAGATFSEINSLANNQGSFEVTTHNFTTAGALTNSGSANAFFNSTLTVAGNLTNSGLTGSYANSTVAVQGNLVNSGQLATGSAASPGTTFRPGTFTVAGTLTQSSAGTTFGSGSLTATTLSFGGTLRPGDRDEENTITAAVGTLTLNGQVGLLNNTSLVFDLASTAASDRITVNGALTLDGTLNVNALAGFAVGRYDLLDYKGALTNNVLDLGTLPGGYNYAIDTSIAGQVDLVVTSAVPEPTAWTAMLTGAGLLAVTLHRRAASQA